MGNLTSVTDPLGRVTAYEYDAMGNKISETMLAAEETVLSSTLFEDDTRGHLIKQTRLRCHPNFLYLFF